jgi:hypothetical protein
MPGHDGALSLEIEDRLMDHETGKPARFLKEALITGEQLQ